MVRLSTPDRPPWAIALIRNGLRGPQDSKLFFGFRRLLTSFGLTEPCSTHWRSFAAETVGRELGKLAARKDALTRQLASVEREIAAVGRQVSKALGGERPAAKTLKTVAKAGKRVMSPEARAKMAAAAKRRWAAATKAGKNALS